MRLIEKAFSKSGHRFGWVHGWFLFNNKYALSIGWARTGLWIDNIKSKRSVRTTYLFSLTSNYYRDTGNYVYCVHIGKLALTFIRGKK